MEVVSEPNSKPLNPKPENLNPKPQALSPSLTVKGQSPGSRACVTAWGPTKRRGPGKAKAPKTGLRWVQGLLIGFRV